MEAFGKLTALVNNAAIVALGQIGKFDMAKWQQVIDVNLTGTFLGMQAVVEEMKKAGEGSIINVSSIEGLRGAPMVHPTSHRSGRSADSPSRPRSNWAPRTSGSTRSIRASFVPR